MEKKKMKTKNKNNRVWVCSDCGATTTDPPNL